jgi:hypothetical protein
MVIGAKYLDELTVSKEKRGTKSALKNNEAEHNTSRNSQN